MELGPVCPAREANIQINRIETSEKFSGWFMHGIQSPKQKHLQV